MQTVTVLYGERRTAYWILGFTTLHIVITPFFLWMLGIIGVVGSLFSFALLSAGNGIILRDPTPKRGLQALLLFHASLLVYIFTILLASIF
ncbi:MAG: hypothetical protein GWO20_00240 [Candidatus Korarchaeota archaeon]|nr:hypothetical protein [Candidatus Korarchaeota archaeon]NIU81975.1 hypothetical protein [Candidatus Thorarchaeota archaeon]NIW12426.1 hypothetical protein [Candidatus Thorarchaeota archaeon]NIW50649.1 hypothetical protein [Candidatus Korarchaeota archaeon]